MTILYRTLAAEPLFSLIVISRDDPRLFACLRSISALRQASLIELVVLLDRSNFSYTQRVLDLMRDFPLPVVVAQMEVGRGIADARNQGASLATASMLIYIDSDCTISSDYVLQMQPLLENPIVTGKVVFCSRSSWFSRLNSAVRQWEYDHVFNHYIRSPNLCIRKEVLERVGGYEPGVPGDDFVLNQKCYLAGYRPVYDDRLVVYHHDDETIRKTMRTWFSYGIGNAYRLKRERQLFGKEEAPLPVTFTTHMQRPSLFRRLFVWMRSAVINAGFLYGTWYWRNITIPSLPFTPIRSTGREYNRYSQDDSHPSSSSIH